jgi:primosomal protein N' (replication factor Y)
MKKNKIAQIIPLARLQRNLHYFDYLVPDKLLKEVKQGQLVEIPFRNKILKGFIFNLSNKTETVGIKLKSISKTIEPSPILFAWQINLIKLLAQYYFVSMAVIAKMIIPDIPKKQRASKDKFFWTIDFKNQPKLDLSGDEFYKASRPVLLRYYHWENKIKVYLSLINKVIKKNKQILIIAPEISDLKRIYQYLFEYKDITSVLLNDLPKNKYWREWQNIRDNKIKIILGTRSAIFASFSKLDLIIIDSEDNENHKQEEPNPRYNVKDVALILKQLLKCRLIYTAVTPSLNSLYKVQQKKWQFGEIDKFTELPEVRIIDREEEFKKGNFSMLSEALVARIDYNLKRAQKIFLFLNRKGFATLVSCKDCGYVATCPTCKLPLTYHVNKKLVCHHCLHEENLFLFCPQCQGLNLKFTGTGTEKVESELAKLFPLAKIAKCDQETSLGNDKLANIDIIIGTQYAFDLIDWTSLNLVGVINADLLFYLPDYRGMEKTYNLLTKLISYMATEKKEMIIQTFTPNNYVFKSIIRLDCKNFYLRELRERKAFLYPPYSRLVRLIYQSIEFNNGQKEIERLFQQLKLINPQQLIISPPLMAYTQQVSGRWRWQILIKILDKNLSLEFLKNIPENVIIDIDPENLL